jgi:hypothetical protein
MSLGKIALSAVVACGVGHAVAAPALGVGACVGPKIVAVRQLPGGRTAFDGTAAPILAAPGGAPTGKSIPVGETYLVIAAQHGFLQLKASNNSGNLAPGTVVGWVALATVTYFYGPHNCE